MGETGPPRRGPIRTLIDFYHLQLRVLWTWRDGPLALLWRVLVSLAVSVASLLFAALVLPGFRITEPWAALGAAIALGLVYLVVRPLLLAIVMPISGILVAVVALGLQSVLVMLIAPFIPGLEIDGFWPAFWASWIIAFANTVLTAVFALDSDDTYFGTLVHQLTTRDAERIDEPGVLIIQIDGLAHDILRHQVRAGRVPVLSRWLRSRSHRLAPWVALLPSQTSASQAGILHGNNDGIPAFRWYEKDAGRLMVSNRPRDAAEIERRASNGEGLLSRGGTSIGNVVSGDAAHSFLTMAVLADRNQGIGASRAFYGFFLSPYNYLHTVVRFVGEVLKERYQLRRQRRSGIEPRLERGRTYAFLRAATNVVLRDLGTTLAMEEMYKGTPVIYIDYTDYDEIAHHSGPERAEALEALDGVDRAIGSLERAAQDALRPYRFVILSDHGQSLGATFRQRFGVSLEETVRSLLGGAAEVVAATSEREEWGPINKFLTELSSGRGATPALARAALRGQRDGSAVDAGPNDERVIEQVGKQSDLVVVASGNLGLILVPDPPWKADVREHLRPSPRFPRRPRESPGHRPAAGTDRGTRRHRRGPRRHLLSRGRSRRGHRPGRTVRSLRAGIATSAGRYGTRAGRCGHQHGRSRYGGGRGLRGADWVPRRDGRPADLPLRALSRGVGSPRGGTHRRTSGVPADPRVARRARSRARRTPTDGRGRRSYRWNRRGRPAQPRNSFSSVRAVTAVEAAAKVMPARAIAVTSTTG